LSILRAQLQETVNRPFHSAYRDRVSLCSQVQRQDQKEDEGTNLKSFHEKNIHRPDTRKRPEHNGFCTRLLPTYYLLCRWESC